ncbi:MAG: tetratricopeptide repeat protein, partial [Gammaproteobacteria bacterium]
MIETINNHDLSQELIDSPCINFSECKNYYLTIFKIFKRIYPKINFDNIISQLECYHQSITDQLGLFKIYTSSNLQKSIIENDKLYKSSAYNKWLIMILLGLILTAIWWYKKIMLQESSSQRKSIIQRFLATTRPKFYITSYIPEILTGYEHFIGRKKELQQIEQNLNQDNIVVITGQGGIGKSSCAIEYGKLNKLNKIVRYLNAESTDKIDQQYRGLAQELNINVEKQPRNIIMQLVNNKLNTIPTELLFIFDNVDQYDDTKEYLINLPINIKAIVTTRQPMLIANKPHIAFEEFSNEEAAQYLKSSLLHRGLNKEFIYKLVENIGTLPYDIKCMAAYLLDNPSIDNEMVTKEISKKIKNKLFHEFIASADPIQQQAWEILQYAANLDPDFISIDIIKELFPKNVELSSKALKKLESLSLISIINVQNEHPGFKVHRNLQKNVQNSAKIYFEHSLNRQKLLANLLKVLDRLFPSVTHTSNLQWQITSRLQAPVEKLLNTEITVMDKNSKINSASLHYKLATYHLIVTVNYLKAFNHAKLSLDQMHVLYTYNHIELANVYNIIGIISRKLGNIAEGLNYSKKGLKIRQKVYLGDHADIADSLYSIGNAYNQNGELQQGLKYSQLALDMNRRLYSKPHPKIGYSLNVVGVCYIDLGDLKKSLEHFKSGLKIFTMLDPIDYEGAATLQSNIAYSYNKLGDHLKALKHAKASVDIFKKLYPNGHPRAIYSLDDFGNSLIMIGN